MCDFNWGWKTFSRIEVCLQVPGSTGMLSIQLPPAVHCQHFLVHRETLSPPPSSPSSQGENRDSMLARSCLVKKVLHILLWSKQMFYGFAMCNVYSIACTNSKNGLIIMPDEDRIFIEIKQRDNKWFLLSLVLEKLSTFTVCNLWSIEQNYNLPVLLRKGDKKDVK